MEKWVSKSKLATQAGVCLDCITNLCKQYEEDIKRLYPRYSRYSRLLPPNVAAFLREKYVIT